VRFLIESEIHGDDYVLSMGGGTLSDLAGFVCSTFIRSVQWISVPTTLIAQVDCAVGGKTALNVGSLKDYIGTFYWPNVIFVDSKFLETLPDRQFRVAVPELAKVGMIGDGAMFSQLCQAVGNGAGIGGLRQRVREFIQPAINVKTEVTRRDPFQDDLRQVLLTGHTTAHALESASNLHMHHGEAVGIGLAFESFFAEKRGLLGTAPRKQLIDVMENCGLQTSLPGELPDRVLVDNMRHEKRNRGRTISMVLPYEPGKALDDWPAPHVELPPDEVWSALSAYRMVCA
jgi:3-dehydroquinate synthase